MKETDPTCALMQAPHIVGGAMTAGAGHADPPALGGSEVNEKLSQEEMHDASPGPPPGLQGSPSGPCQP
jgi:hypothetical protein